MYVKTSLDGALILLANEISVSCVKDNPITVPEVFGISEDQIADIEGNIYKTVKIGNQVWMAENLRTTKYRNCFLTIRLIFYFRMINNLNIMAL